MGPKDEMQDKDGLNLLNLHSDVSQSPSADKKET